MTTSTARTLPRSLAILVGASAAAVALPMIGTALKTEYKESRVFDVTFSSESSSETTAMEITIDGEPMDRGGRGGGGGGRTTMIEYSYSDTILAAKEGAPTKVKRTFDSVEGGMEMEMRDDVMEVEMQSAFDGLTLLLSDTEDGVVVEVPEGEAPDEERLKGHALALPLDGLLPDDEVDPGDEWEIEGDALVAALGISLQSKLIDRPERAERGEGEGRGRGGRGRAGRFGGGGGGDTMLASGEWDITATLTDTTEDIDGVTAMVIEIKAEVEGEPPAREGRGGRDRAAGLATSSTQDSSYTGEFEGTLYWSAEENRPVRFEIKGMVELNTETERETQRGTMSMSRTQETTMEISIDVAARTADK